MNAGDAFYVERSVDTHLWVVLSDPSIDPGNILLVSLTTYKSYKEAVCLIDPGEHPRISHRTCAAYNQARLTDLASLQRFEAAGQLRLQPPVSEQLLAKLRRGVGLSTQIKYRYVELLLVQGLID